MGTGGLTRWAQARTFSLGENDNQADNERN